MKKIALLHFAYPPNIGGVEILLKEHALILANLGYQVSVITGDGQEIDKKINLIKIPEIQSIIKFNPSLYEKIVEKGMIDNDFYLLVKTIEDKLKQYLNQIDIYIIHNMVTLVHNLPFVYFIKDYLKKNPEKKLIVWAHDQTYIDGENILKDKPGVNLNPELKKLLLDPIENATYVVISETFKSLLTQVMDLSKNKTVVIPNGINIKKFLEIEDSIWQVVEKTNLMNCFPIILSPVNILSRKNLEKSIKVVSILKKTYPNVKYIITGQVSNHRKNQDYYQMIVKKINQLDLKNNIIFIKDFFKRSLENKEIHDLYQLSDLVFFFSKAENFGLPIIESALTKTPVFASDLKVFKEISSEYLQFIDIKNNDSNKIAWVVLNYLENSNLIKLNKRVKQSYNLESIIKEKLVPLL